MMTESGIGYRADNTVLSPNTFLPLSNANYISFKKHLDAGDNMVNSVCLNCGKEFWAKSETSGKYCSYDCYWQSMRTRSQYSCINLWKPIYKTAGRVSMLFSQMQKRIF